VLRNSRDVLAAVAVVLVLTGCSKAQPVSELRMPEAPNPFPTFDGVPRSGVMGREALRIDPGPDSTYLFHRMLDCWPARSWFRPELSFEMRAGQRSATYDGGASGSGATVVFRTPLYSEAELDREREREAARRNKTAAAVSSFIENLVTHRLVEREIQIWKGSEAWSAWRVRTGAAPTTEQHEAEKRVYMLEIKRVETMAKVVTARLDLVGLCSNDKGAALNEYLRGYLREEPGHKADEAQDVQKSGRR
jgi:hypothetical protein